MGSPNNQTPQTEASSELNRGDPVPSVDVRLSASANGKKRARSDNFRQPGDHNTHPRRKLRHQVDDAVADSSLLGVSPDDADKGRSDDGTESLEEPMVQPDKLNLPVIKKPFCLFDRLLRHPEITLRLAAIMDVQSLVDMYAISKPFHFFMNSHFTTYIRSSANIHAPDSAYVFPWRCYRRLTIKDPGFRLNSGNVTRDVPGLKWLQMVSRRHDVVLQIIRNLEEHGHSFPGKPNELVLALKKMWFIMDLPRNGPRIGVMHNTGYWTDRDILIATTFLVKLDMRLTDPVEGTGEISLRNLMLGQRSLCPLRDLLLGRLNKVQLMRMWVLYDWKLQPAGLRLPCLGVPPHLVGRGCLENWGLGNVMERMLRPDELLVRENIRRGLDLHLNYLEMMRWGYKTGEQDSKARAPRLRDRRPLLEHVDSLRVEMDKERKKEDGQPNDDHGDDDDEPAADIYKPWNPSVMGAWTLSKPRPE
ncbi:uncharacterized protein PV09_02011 [Verruconis gallopava]|uniref:Uncharacterized protein n=1 Tax=Verruconis gallopava TaxID=253628 RepID=A0A0D2B7B5_9PEZI|nr:uncharacterized protein PV09_02011 [Verruconis gallopava]KIW07139.1 hypothetical protein PV09_02011 [Verruconis gallopava]